MTKKLTLDKSVKMGDNMIKEAEFGGAFVAAIRFAHGKFYTRISENYVNALDIKRQDFVADTAEELLAKVEVYINDPANAQDENYKYDNEADYVREQILEMQQMGELDHYTANDVREKLDARTITIELAYATIEGTF